MKVFPIARKPLPNYNWHQSNYVNNIPIIRFQPENVTSKETKLTSILRGFAKYCSSTTLHGLRYVGDPDISLLERTFWFGAFVTAALCSLFFIANIYQKYETSPVIISFNPRMVTLKEIPFPAITICNVNIALKSRARFIETKSTYLKRRLLSDLCQMNSSFPHCDNCTMDAEADQMHDNFEWATVRDLIIDINQKCGEMFKACKWNGKMQNCHELINTILTDEGYCCSFNKLPVNYSLRNDFEQVFRPSFPKDIVDWNPEDGYPPKVSHHVYPYRSHGSGQQLGLTVILDADLDQYYCTTTNSVGFKVILSTPIEAPKVADISWLVAPGMETRVAIGVDIEDTTDTLRHIDFKKRQCFYTRERYLRFYRFYTERNCRLECEANYTLLHCGCVPYYLPKDSNVFVCDQKRDSCTDKAKNMIERYSPQSELCNCLPACFEIKYFPESVTSGKMLPEMTTVPSEISGNYTSEYYSKNMAVLHFYFPTNKFRKRTKGEIYGFAEFLSNTGGLLGLFLGFSFMSAVEIVYFLCLSNIFRFFRRRNSTHSEKTVKTNVSVYPYIN